MNTAQLLLLVLFWVGVSPAFADEVSRCRLISDATQRLACFDRVFPPVQSRLTDRDLTAKSNLSEVGAGTEASGRHGTSPATDPPEALRIIGTFKGWAPGRIVRLSNGVEVLFSDGTAAVYDLQSPAVALESGLVGGWFLRIEGVTQIPRVTLIFPKRLQ